MTTSKTDETGKSQLPMELRLTMDFDLVNTLSLIELIYALHDAGVLDKTVMHDRLNRLSSRTDLDLSDVVRNMIRFNAQALSEGQKTNE